MKKNILLILSISVFLSSCQILNLKTLMNLDKLKFKLDSISDVKVMDISVKQLSSFDDLNFLDIARLTASIAGGKLPVKMTVNVAVNNPNQPSTEIYSSDISLKSFPWKLYIDDNETIAGSLREPVMIKGSQTSILPFDMELNLLDYFKGEKLSSLFNLALKIGGAKSDPANVKLIAEPVLDTPLGDMTYPEPITIINKNFN